MSNGHSDDLFLKDLQRQCLDDSREYLEGVILALKTFVVQPEKSVSVILSCAHSLKGNLQAAGFTFFGELVHQFESVLVKLEKVIPNRSKYVGFDLAVAEFLISDIHFQLTNYKNELMSHLHDTEEQCQPRMGPIKNLESWITEVSANFSVQSGDRANQTLIDSLTRSESMPERDAAKTFGGSASSGVSDVPDKERTKEFNRIHLLIGNGGQKYAIPITQVSEILQPHEVIEVPSAASHIKGLIRLKDSIVSLIDLSSAIGKSIRPRYLLRCHVGAKEFAFEVDEAEQVIELEQTTIQRLDISKSGKPQDKDVVEITTIKDTSVTILNLETWIAV